MTEEQMTLIKTLIKKHGISATDGEWTLVFLGASYGLTEKQITSPVSRSFYFPSKFAIC